ncbi:MAG TPA: ImmA/IrrE family metallo-endopeptidase [Allosphingosinicella sp.]
MAAQRASLNAISLTLARGCDSLLRMPEASDVHQQVEPLNWSKLAVCRFAGDFADMLNLSPGADLEPVVHMYGGVIQYQDVFEAEDSKDGSIVIEADGRFVVYLPDYVSVERNRFTLAHELGHYVLHKVIAEKNVPLRAARMTNAENGRAEWEANWFAAGFLMPQKQFSAYVEAAQNDIVSVARKFKVSLEAARYQKEFYEQNPLTPS